MHTEHTQQHTGKGDKSDSALQGATVSRTAEPAFLLYKATLVMRTHSDPRREYQLDLPQTRQTSERHGCHYARHCGQAKEWGHRKLKSKIFAKDKSMAGKIVQLVQCLPGMPVALSSSLRTHVKGGGNPSVVRSLATWVLGK